MAGSSQSASAALPLASPISSKAELAMLRCSSAGSWTPLTNSISATVQRLIPCATGPSRSPSPSAASAAFLARTRSPFSVLALAVHSHATHCSEALEALDAAVHVLREDGADAVDEELHGVLVQSILGQLIAGALLAHV